MKYFLTLLILPFTLLCSAQQYVDLATIEHTHQTQGANGLLPGESPYNSTTIDILLPLVLNERAAIILGFAGEQTTLSTTERICNPLYGATLKIGANIKHTDHLSVTYVALPRLASDLHFVDRNHLQIGGILLAKYLLKEDLNIRFGVYANRDFFGPFVVPLIGLYVKRGRWEAKGVIPINGEVSYALRQDVFHIGARFEGINRSYQIGANTNARSYIEKANNEVGLFAQAQHKHIAFRLMMGQSLGRKLSKFASGDASSLALPLYKFDNDRNTLREVRPNGLFLRASLIYRLPTS